MLEDAALEIEILPANGRCLDCGREFHATVCGGVCPDCGSRNMKIISGRDFSLRKLSVYEEKCGGDPETYRKGYQTV